MVGNSPPNVEWAEPTVSTPYPDNRNGCLHDQVRSVLSGEKNRRSVVQSREGVAHQLPGAAWSHSGDEMFCQRA